MQRLFRNYQSFHGLLLKVPGNEHRKTFLWKIREDGLRREAKSKGSVEIDALNHCRKEWTNLFGLCSFCCALTLEELAWKVKGL